MTFRNPFTYQYSLPADDTNGSAMPTYEAIYEDGHLEGIGDAVSAATALDHDLSLVTQNTEDFAWIDDRSLVHPFDAGKTDD